MFLNCLNVCLNFSSLYIYICDYIRTCKATPGEIAANLGLPENDIAIKLKTIVVEKFDPLVQYFKSGDGEADVKQVACLNVYVYSIYIIYIYIFIYLKRGQALFPPMWLQHNKE